MHFELASDERAEEMVDFLREHFFADETLSKSVGLVMNECRRKLLLERYKDNLSLLLVSDVTKQIIGVRTIKIIEAGGNTLNLDSIEDERIRKVLTFLRHKQSEMDVYKYYGVDIAVNFINLGIHRDFRNRGLGSILMKAAMLYVKDIGLDPVCITGEGTSNYSQKIYEKFGFEVMHCVNYEDYKVDGEVVFKNTGDNKSCKFYAKKL
jgi:ribosomal protein S18 acetylase RimI-like enzyme